MAGTLWPSYVTELHVAKADFKFNAAHFVVHDEGREKLHGHNYCVSITITGGALNADTGYLIDFGVIKPIVRDICKTLDEKFLFPTGNRYLTFRTSDNGKNIELTLRDGSFFSFPTGDVVGLPVANITVEELARHILEEFTSEFGRAKLDHLGIRRLGIAVGETPGQEARVFVELPAHT
jgi:6-pyruvoyl tetrahydropterin synthase/QueD family protein